MDDLVRRSVVTDETLTELISLLSHDLRGPLSSLVLHTGLLEGVDLSGDEKEDLAHVVAAGRELRDMLAMVADLGQFLSDRASLDAIPCDVASLVRESIASLPDGSPARVRLSESGVARVACDRSRVSRAVRELLTSALRFTPEDLPVDVRIEISPAAARVGVLDNGIRVPSSMHEMMFDLVGALEIRRSHREFSRGLGPVYAALTARAHGGSAGILQRGADERGNVLWIELPTF